MRLGNASETLRTRGDFFFIDRDIDKSSRVLVGVRLMREAEDGAKLRPASSYSSVAVNEYISDCSALASGYMFAEVCVPEICV
jgi:hypothetical protein